MTDNVCLFETIRIRELSFNNKREVKVDDNSEMGVNSVTNSKHGSTNKLNVSGDTWCVQQRKEAHKKQ
jgi:hypothetical protein